MSSLLSQVMHLSQITTDVGRSRAWLRLALNDGLLTSYFSLISNDNSALAPYYKRYAFLRDQECLNVAMEYLKGLTRFNFSFPVNSSMLNIWPNQPLLLAGLWTPPMKDVPISAGTDIVKGIVEVAEADENLSVASFPSSSGRLYEEEEALKIILGTPIEGSPLQSRIYLEETNECQHSRSDTSEIPSINPEEHIVPVDDVKEDEELKEPDVSHIEEEINSTLKSYHKVIDTYQVKDSDIAITNLDEIIKKFSPNIQESTIPEKDSPSSSSLQKSVVLDEYEVIEKSSVVHSVPEFKGLIQQLGKFGQEKGLVEQNFACKQCGLFIGFSFSSKAWVCALTGSYFCKACFKPVECAIPSKILHNWDFTKYPVSEWAAKFLRDVQEFPLFDIRRINPRLYLFFPEILSLQKLRLQLNYIRSYLFTCHDQMKERIKQLLWPREYLYEHVHLYAVADLLEIPMGKLEELLKRAIKLSIDHILTCQLCSQKGYFCEVCKDGQVIYPFQIDTTYRCATCRTVYHLECKQESCPKCERIKKRKFAAES